MISTDSNASSRKTIVVIGHGMVGHRFCEKLVAYDLDKRYRIVTFCEEPRAAYDRVGLTSFFAHRDAEQLMLARMDWYREQGIELHVGDRATRIDRDAQVVHSEQGCAIPYDEIVLATGSYPFVPPMEGTGKLGVFVYRTIEDLERIIESSKKAKSAAVLGGGLLGLEAAKATYDLGMTTHVVEFAQRLMPRQVDDAGSRILVKQIESMGVEVHLNRQTQSILGNGRVTGLSFADGESLDVDMVVISAGIRPRDELARESGIAVGERGGIVVDDALQTSDPCIFAIGEVALHQSMIYGLVAPGYEMADILASNLCGKDLVFQGADLSAKLKLMGVDVASFGDNAAEGDDVQPLIFEDPFAGIYKKLLLSKDGKRLLGGVLVGDASEYSTLASICKSGADLPVAPGALIAAGGGAALGADALSDDAQVCSCNAVTKGQICEAIQGDGLRSADDVKTCTQAGAGCGGCMPLVTDIFNAEMEKAGVTLVNHVCEHFSFSRQELFEIIKIKQYKSFPEVLRREGTGHGCELCKPTVASILASLWNDPIVEHDTIQDSNDRFLANIQRTGLYSVVPRVPGGEITPDKLIVLGEVAKKYDLYTKITGGQRVDLFGARVEQLPDIWEELINAGFESGHAYGKALRTVKSCVGTTWCRFGVQDAVGFAIRVEERYRGIRSPHKLKGGVSGCTRECAEAQSKDFGLIATEKGWNLFVCGNGGRKPRHADLFATDLDEETVIRYIDRFLMYYIHTADKLTRTSV
ncbi:MAG: nitrite reductase large subunit NirB, partial [Kiritimatiellae bacterium]|nr:nitrite reductase large subunit NirB [Kiritimatiellia bacterium]